MIAKAMRPLRRFSVIAAGHLPPGPSRILMITPPFV